jgi:hypothetical protein
MTDNPLAWDIGRESNTEQLEEAAKKAYEENINFLKAFNTPAGKAVMEWLVKHTLDTPSWWPDADYNKSVANGFWREGQNSLVRQLRAKIEQAKTYQEKNK